jgi:hypothetical protein
MKTLKTKEVMENMQTSFLKNFFTNKNITYILSALLVISLGTGIYFYKKANEDPQKIKEAEAQKAVTAVGKLIVLPADEIPDVATVTGPEKLRDSPFFANAEKGDMVLLYKNSRKAILYRPSINKIIEVSPVSLPEGQ